MRNLRFLRHVRAKWEEVWAIPNVKLAFVFVATALGTGTYYYPIIKTMYFNKPDLPKEQLSLYDKEHLYPIKVRKQREQEKQQAFANSQKPQSS